MNKITLSKNILIKYTAVFIFCICMIIMNGDSVYAELADISNYDLTDTAYNPAGSVVANGDSENNILVVSGEGRISKWRWLALEKKLGDFWSSSEGTIEFKDDGVISLAADSSFMFGADATRDGAYRGKINLPNNLDTSNVTDMMFMFCCTTSANLDVSNWDVSNVTDMRCMFYGAKSANPDVSSWDVSNVTDMHDMFSGADSANPDVSNWDVSNVTDMRCMFYGAKSANPDVSKWDVSNVTDMHDMFSGADSANPDVSNWDVSNVTDMRCMFYGVKSANPDVSKWDVSNVKNMGGMFSHATSANPDVSKWDVSNVTDMSSMFSGATSANPDVSNWDVSNVTDMLGMFWDATSANPDVSNWDVSNVTGMSLMFSGATSAKNISLLNNNEEGINGGGIFKRLSSLQNLKFNNLKNASIEDSGAFRIINVTDGITEYYDGSEPYNFIDYKEYHLQRYITFDVNTIWLDENDSEIAAPENNGAEIIIELYANDESTGDEIKLNKDNSWTYSFNELPVADSDGNLIEYSIKEKNSKDGKIEIGGTTYQSTVEGDMDSGYTIKNKTVTEYYDIKVSIMPENAGKVEGSGNYKKGDSVTLKAEPESGYRFVNWTEDGVEVSSDKIYTFTASKNRNITAVFEKETEPFVYKFTEGMNGTWTMGSNDALGFKINGDYTKFIGIEIDGAKVSDSDYTAKSGGTIIDIKPEFMQKLNVGKHTIKAYYTDGSCETDFFVQAVKVEETVTVVKTTTPKTGDNEVIGMWLVISLLSVVLIKVAADKKRGLN